MGEGRWRVVVDEMTRICVDPKRCRGCRCSDLVKRRKRKKREKSLGRIGIYHCKLNHTIGIIRDQER